MKDKLTFVMMNEKDGIYFIGATDYGREKILIRRINSEDDLAKLINDINYIIQD